MKYPFKVLCVASIALVAFGCDKNGNQAKPPPPSECQDGKSIKLGEFAAVTVVSADAGQPLSWDTRGTVLTLAAGEAPSVQVIPDENYGGEIGSCLTTPNHVRLSRDRKTVGVDSYLIASPETLNGSKDVHIGNFGPGDTSGPGKIYGRFFLEKIPELTRNTRGPEIRVGDEFRIRGTKHDWWLVVPAGAGAGSKITLSQNPDDATHFTFSHGGP